MGMYQNRTDNKRPSCLICKQTFQPIGDESVCGRCEEQYVRRRRETIENQWEQAETQRKYVETCKSLLADAGLFKKAESSFAKGKFSQDSPELEHQLRDYSSRDLTPEQTVSEIIADFENKNRNGSIVGCIVGIVIIILLVIIGLIGQAA